MCTCKVRNFWLFFSATYLALYLRKAIIFALLSLCVFAMYGCGKRTDPIPLSVINKVPKPDKVEITKSKYGVSIYNNQQRYRVVVYRSDFNVLSRSYSKYKEIATVKPQVVYFDKDVEVGGKYVYKLVNLDDINTESLPRTQPLQYAPPSYISSIKLKDDTDGVLLTISASVNTYKMVVYVNGIYDGETNSDLYKTTKYYSDIDNISIVPYDNFLLEGEKYFMRVDNSQGDIKHIKANLFNSEVVIIWDYISGVNSYEVSVSRSSSVLLKKVVHSPVLRFESNILSTGNHLGCFEVTIKTIMSDGQSSADESTQNATNSSNTSNASNDSTQDGGAFDEDKVRSVTYCL